MSKVIEVESGEELHNILNENPRVLIKFMAEWCAPCHRLAPHFLAASNESDVVFVSVDIEKADDVLKSTFPVQSVPTVLLVEDYDNVTSIVARTSLSILKALA